MELCIVEVCWERGCVWSGFMRGGRCWRMWRVNEEGMEGRSKEMGRFVWNDMKERKMLEWELRGRLI